MDGADAPSGRSGSGSEAGPASTGRAGARGEGRRRAASTSGSVLPQVLGSVWGGEEGGGEEGEGGGGGGAGGGGGGGDEGGGSGRDEAERPGGRGRREARGRAHFVDAEGRPFWVWRAVLGEGSGDEERLSSAARGAAAGEPWAVVLAGGGHFAAAVYGMAPGKGKGPATSRAGHVALAHKTVHRYVTRRKAGGRQSTKDAQSGTKAPKSVGASLRIVSVTNSSDVT